MVEIVLFATVGAGLIPQLPHVVVRRARETWNLPIVNDEGCYFFYRCKYTLADDLRGAVKRS
jgi:hypothetical protein